MVHISLCSDTMNKRRGITEDYNVSKSTPWSSEHMENNHVYKIL